MLEDRHLLACCLIYVWEYSVSEVVFAIQIYNMDTVQRCLCPVFIDGLTVVYILSSLQLALRIASCLWDSV
jgi:hypothetical protein